jgi:hypothetical protein
VCCLEAREALEAPPPKRVPVPVTGNRTVLGLRLGAFESRRITDLPLAACWPFATWGRRTEPALRRRDNSSRFSASRVWMNRVVDRLV